MIAPSKEFWASLPGYAEAAVVVRCREDGAQVVVPMSLGFLRDAGVLGQLVDEALADLRGAL